MAIPVLHSLSSPDLDRGQLPADPTSCAVAMNADIGLANGGADTFRFVVVTPDQLLAGAEQRWGRGYLVVQEFSWVAVERAVAKLLMHADRTRWEESARELAKELHWEYEGYNPRT